MKREIYILILIVFLVLFSFFEANLVNYSIDEVLKQSEVITQNINEGESKEDILNKAEKLKDFWQDSERKMCLYINHKDMEKIGEQIRKTVSFIKNDKHQNAIEELELLTFLVNGFKHTSDFNFQNIF